ncbi:tetratricopeptide repeat protein [Empedobacter falsenii]|uniref:tetratricopeptide repeat protein n=1 Tax=Empedobacter TaxID=59734 RepID=UPI0005708CF3|nr:MULTISPECIES: tetratricopeptide repeat protein [Empedobacter]MDH1882373.1 tetratricopeptide repeat protein [Empedobacter sp. GD03797]MDM1040670.1 tetratricopeptide repeat protein [Empedobacter brevis]MDM1135555.1 tetratricopeptide repeat protein [Empedobacter sp. R750]HAR72227.1 tetratricopeptide repeat protein [Flavobacteriaceae bacterium]
MKYSVYFTIFLLNCIFCFGQSDSIELKNIYDVARENIYNNPKKAISQADVLIKNSHGNVGILVDSYFLKANAYSNLRDNEKALFYLNKTYTIVKSLKNDAQKVDVIHRIATIYQNLKLYDKSLSYLNEAEKIISQLKNEDKKFETISYNYTVRGLIFKDLNNCETAIDYFNKAIKNYDKINNKFIASSNKSVIYYNLGFCYFKTNVKTSEEAYHKSYELAKKSGTNILIAYSLKGLGEYYFKTNNYETSLDYLNKSLQSLDKTEDPTLKRNIYNLISLNAIAKQDWQLFEEADSLSSIYNKQVVLSETKSVYKAIQSIEEDANYDEKKSLFTSIFTIILSFIIILLISFLYFRKKKKITSENIALNQELSRLLNKEK